MMAFSEPSASITATAKSTAIIGPHYCSPHAVDFTITKERTMADNFTVTDVNGNIVFEVRSSLVTIFTPRQRRVLYDAAGTSLLHLRRKLLAACDIWEAFRSESSTESHDLIFTRKRSSLFQLKTKLDVFLASNTTQACDFKVKESLSRQSCVVYAGESDTIVAQMEKKFRTMFDKESYSVTVYPNVDYAFIVALVVTLDELS